MPITIFKPLGLTPLELIKKYKQENNISEKMSFAGRLDPMAFGQMILLKGEDCKLQDTYCGKDKIYEFKIIFGLETDSLDILGIPKILPLDFKCHVITQGKIEQKYPRYSSKVISIEGKSKPLWWWEKQGKLEESLIPEKEVEIYEIEELSYEIYTSSYLNKIINDRLSKLTENNRDRFRYNTIKDNWDELLRDKRQFEIKKFRTKVSSGTYIRGLCQKMGGVALDIHRTNIIF